MKTLFVHLSDAHFEENTYISDKIIDAQVQALNSIEKFDYCFILFSGDIASSGEENQYKKARFYLGRLWNKICEKNAMQRFKVQTLIVPGNHDINFNGVPRDRSEVRAMLNEGNPEEFIESELQRFGQFYKYAEYLKCFLTYKLCDCKIYNINDKKIQINLINSELFSACNDSLNDDDKGLHYLPNNTWESLERKKDVDFVITMSHRSPEWFDWSTSQAFKKHLLRNADIFLYGHEHFDDIQDLCQKDNSIVKSIAQGLNFKEGDISFSTLLVDFDQDRINTKMFAWNREEEMFVGRNDWTFEISKEHNSQYLIQPNDIYKKEIAIDEDKQILEKYYVFPGLEEAGKDNEIKEMSDLLMLITQKKHIIIEGDDSSGKTSLLKQIYLALIGEYVPIYLSAETIINKNSEKVLKIAFETQYGSKAIDFEKYQQIDKDKKIVLIDDLSKIKQKYVDSLQEYLLSQVGHIVCVVEPKVVPNFIEQIKDKYEIGDVVRLKLLPFYATKRLELIKKNLTYINHGEYQDIKEQAENINNFIRENIKLFSLSPRFIKMYVDFYVNEAEMTNNSNKNVFGRVFETNLVNRIRKFASDVDIDEYSYLLEEIAYQIHFNEKYPLPLTDLVSIIDNYNCEYGLNVNIQKFCQTMIDAKVLVEEDNSYFFYKDSFLAYFVAKSLNTRYNNGEGKDEIKTLIENICFNINGDILLFLSYITSNLFILNIIKEAAEKHMATWTEFDIDQKNIGFIFNAECPINNTLPTKADRKAKDKREEKYERTVSKTDTIERNELYVYDKEDVNTDDYKIGQAFRFMELICKILPGFNHRLKVQEKSEIVKDIFEFPNKILYKIFAPLDMHYDNIVKLLFDTIKKYKEDITEDEIRRAIVQLAETLILNVYDICARLSITDKTVKQIEMQELKNTNNKIQHIMFYENLGYFGQFTDEANDLFDHTKLSIVKSMVSRIVRKHFLFNKDLKLVGKVESVAKKYFGESFKRTDLLK